MRLALFAIGTLFIFAGIAAIVWPQSSVVPHASSRYKPPDAEVISKEQCVAYGTIAIGLGVVGLFAALSWKRWQSEEKGRTRR